MTNTNTAATAKEQVLSLRASGMSFPKIAAAVPNMTVMKARTICKGLTVVSPLQACVNRVYQAAISSRGICQSELHIITIEEFGTVRCPTTRKHVPACSAETKKEIKRMVRTKADKENTVAVFVPDWMDTEEPDICNRDMLAAAQELQERFCDIAAEFVSKWPRANSYSVKAEILALAFYRADREGVESRCSRNQVTVDRLTSKADVALPTKAQKSAFAQSLLDDFNLKNPAPFKESQFTDPNEEVLAMSKEDAAKADFEMFCF